VQHGAARQKVVVPLGKGLDPVAGGIGAKGFQQARPAQMFRRCL
jgi:hypothetical protein